MIKINKYFPVFLCLLFLSECLISCKESNSIEDLRTIAHKLDSLHSYNEALKMYDSILAIDSKDVDAYLNRSVDRGILGDKDGEIRDLQEIIKLDSSNVLAYFNLGIVHGNVNDVHESLRNFNLAIHFKGSEKIWLEEKPNLFIDTYRYDCSMEEIRLERGIVYYRADSVKQAYFDFTFCIERRYELGESYYYRALNYKRAGMNDLACQDFRNSLKYGKKNVLGLTFKDCDK